MFAPAKTPAAIINRLNQEIVRVLNRPEVKERFLNGWIRGRRQFAGAVRGHDKIRYGQSGQGDQGCRHQNQLIADINAMQHLPSCIRSQKLPNLPGVVFHGRAIVPIADASCRICRNTLS